MTAILAGDRALAALEAEIEEPRDDRWLFGHFRLFARGEAIGDWDDVVTLRAIVGWWETFISAPVDRWDPQLAGLDARETFDVLVEAAYADGAADGPIRDVLSRFHIDQLGMSAFDGYRLLLVEPPEGGQWLLWQREDIADRVHEASLPTGTLQTIGAEFVAAFSAVAPIGD